jgi:hypothetical protein
VPAHIDPYIFDQRAIEATRARLATLTVSDLDRPSTCSGWDIRAVLAHLVGGNIPSPRHYAVSRLIGRPGTWSR